jgi:hypothetical protein
LIAPQRRPFQGAPIGFPGGETRRRSVISVTTLGDIIAVFAFRAAQIF